MVTSRRSFVGALLGAPVAAASGPATAQSIPTRRLIVPFPPGGAVDMLGRLLAEQLQAAAGGRVVVENVGGVGAMAGIAQVAQSAPDGSVLGVGAAANLITNKYLFASMPYDPERDLLPLTRIATGTVLCVANTRIATERGWNTFADLIAWARANPGRVNMGSSGNGQTSHLTIALVNERTRAQITHVPYRGGGPAITDLVAGHIDIMFDVMPALMPHVRSGAFKALAVGSGDRHPQLPDVPGMKEFAALNLGDVDIQTWWCMVARAGTPAPIAAALHRAILEAVASPMFQERTRAGGIIPVTDASPEALATYVRSQDAFWREMVRISGARLD